MSFVGGGVGNVGLKARLRASAAPPAALPGPWLDTFTTPATGGIIGRVTESGAQAYTHERYTGTAEAFAVSSGVLTSVGTGNPFQAFALLEKPVGSGFLWVRRTIDNLNSGGTASATYVGASHVTVNPGGSAANWLYARFGNITGNITAFDVAYVNSASSVATVTGASTANCQHRAGDVIGERYTGIGTDTVQVCGIHNGVRMTPWATVNQTTNPITRKHGVRGSSTARIADLLVGDPVNERLMDVVCQGRIVQRDPTTGAVRPRFVGYFSDVVPAVGSLNYSYFEAAAPNNAISGHSAQPVTGFQSGTSVPAFDSDANFASMLPGSLASPPAAGFYVQIARTDLSSGTSFGRSPYLKAGDVILMDGQSLTAQGNSSTGGRAPIITPSADCWRLDASLEPEQLNGGFFRSRQVRSTTSETNGAMNHLFATIQNANGGLPVQVLTAGYGATLLWERNNSATYAASYKEARNIGIANAGFGLRWAVQTGGQYEVDLPNNGGSGYGTGSLGIANATADFPNQVEIWADEIDALLVQPTKFLIVPLTMVIGTADSDTQEFRRMQKKLCADFPTRFFLGPYSASCNRSFINDAQGDKYHLSKLIVLPALTPDPQIDSGYSNFFTRIGDCINFHEGWQASNKNGPTLVSATRSGNDIIVTFDPNGGTLEFRNGTYLGDFRGGLDFASDTAFTSQIYPTNAVVSGNTVTFTFASAPPANTRVRAAYGTHAFSRGLNVMTNHVGGGSSGTTTSVALDPRTRASMVCSNYGGSPARYIEVQPSLDIGGYGIDYVTAA